MIRKFFSNHPFLSCSNQTTLTFQSVGRLCNQLSSYANMLVYQRLFNVQSYLPSEQVRDRIRNFFENVTMPVLTDNTSVSCRVEVRSVLFTLMTTLYSQWFRVPMFHEFSSENLQCPQLRPTDLCFSPLPPHHLITSPVGLIGKGAFHSPPGFK